MVGCSSSKRNEIQNTIIITEKTAAIAILYYYFAAAPLYHNIILYYIIGTRYPRARADRFTDLTLVNDRTIDHVVSANVCTNPRRTIKYTISLLLLLLSCTYSGAQCTTTGAVQHTDTATLYYINASDCRNIVIYYKL